MRNILLSNASSTIFSLIKADRRSNQVWETEKSDNYDLLEDYCPSERSYLGVSKQSMYCELSRDSAVTWLGELGGPLAVESKRDFIHQNKGIFQSAFSFFCLIVFRKSTPL